jgi:hypothetical protein
MLQYAKLAIYLINQQIIKISVCNLFLLLFEIEIINTFFDLCM